MKATAYAKVILIGEHSVVYGYPAIAIPFKGLKSHAEIVPAKENLLASKYFTGPLKNAPESLLGLKTLIYHLFTTYQIKDTFLITITSQLPEKSGMGSSASVAKALITSFDKYFKLNLTPEDYFNFLAISENIYHQKASGIDASTIIYEHPIIYQNGRATLFPIALNGYLMVIHTLSSSATKEAVNHVKNFPNKEIYLSALNELTNQAINALKIHDITSLGHLFNQAHEQLAALGLSTAKMEQLRTDLLNLGSLGVKLTGGGMGGCLIALFDNKDLAFKAQQVLSDYPSWLMDLEEIQ